MKLCIAGQQLPVYVQDNRMTICPSMGKLRVGYPVYENAVPLCAVTDDYASPVRIQTPSGVLALATALPLPDSALFWSADTGEQEVNWYNTQSVYRWLSFWRVVWSVDHWQTRWGDGVHTYRARRTVDTPCDIRGTYDVDDGGEDPLGGKSAVVTYP